MFGHEVVYAAKQTFLCWSCDGMRQQLGIGIQGRHQERCWRALENRAMLWLFFSSILDSTDWGFFELTTSFPFPLLKAISRLEGPLRGGGEKSGLTSLAGSPTTYRCRSPNEQKRWLRSQTYSWSNFHHCRYFGNYKRSWFSRVFLISCEPVKKGTHRQLSSTAPRLN